jgi:hypothetical protein
MTVLFSPTAAYSASIFDNGQINNFSDTGTTGARVRDSSGGDPTTLNVLSGALLGLTQVEDNSFMNVFPGATSGN